MADEEVKKKEPLPQALTLGWRRAHPLFKAGFWVMLGSHAVRLGMLLTMPEPFLNSPADVRAQYGLWGLKAVGTALFVAGLFLQMRRNERGGEGAGEPGA